MKKKLLLLSTVGAAAAGLVYALESNWRKQSAAKNQSAGKDRAESANGQSAASQVKSSNSKGQAEQAGSMARGGNGNQTIPAGDPQHQLDDHGTDQAQASHILREIRNQAFEASDEKLALALGRPTDEIESWTAGHGLIDGDVLMKARALANQRGLEVE